MIRRHPHVFADKDGPGWESIKAAERAAHPDDSALASLAGVSRGLPEWKRALKLQERAAKVGFDWPDEQPVLDKVLEEVAEVRAEFANGRDPQRLQDEIGDVLFVMVNLARHAGVDFSQAMRHANAKFERRFRAMEQLAHETGRPLSEHDLAAQETLWQRAKQQERPAA